MKKKIAALLLGGVMVAGALSLNVPATVCAEETDEPKCGYTTTEHLTDCTVTENSDGQLTVTVNLTGLTPAEDTVYGTNGGYMAFFTLEKYMGEAPSIENWDNYNDFLSPFFDEWFSEGRDLYRLEVDQNGTYVLPGLTAGKTYYVYAMAYEWHGLLPGEDSGQHQLLYLKSGVPSKDSESESADTPSAPSVCTPAENEETESSESFEESLTSEIQEAQSGSTIVLDRGVTTLSNSTMQELLAKKDVSLKLEFTYNNKDYVILIPAGAAIDSDIPYYGPLYLAQHYGNMAENGNASNVNGTYAVQSGDTLSKIAAANNMTLKQLLAKNPQIKDANRINAGQKLNL